MGMMVPVAGSGTRIAKANNANFPNDANLRACDWLGSLLFYHVSTALCIYMWEELKPASAFGPCLCFAARIWLHQVYRPCLV